VYSILDSISAEGGIHSGHNHALGEAALQHVIAQSGNAISSEPTLTYPRSLKSGSKAHKVLNNCKVGVEY
jgi:hypothetical protein